ncbi:MAG: class I SAM-dependent methyltransferase [Candidatus Hydrothermarchaeales archaeon]
MKERVKRYYEKRARTYEDLDVPETIVSCVRAIGIEDHMKIMGLKKEQLVLDVGCGQGRFLQPFSTYAQTVGIDFTVEMLEKAKDTRALLIRADAEHLPIKSEIFDVVHSAGLLGVYRSARLCGEMVRVTKKGGKIFVSFPAAESVSGVVARLFSKLGWNPTLLDFWYTKDEISSIFPHGIHIKEFHRLGFEPPFQRLYKNLKSQRLVRAFMFFERNLRDKPVFKYFGSRYFVEAER